MKIYSSLSRKKEEFVPIHPPKVTMYACGLTPQNHPHLGHAVAAIRFSVLRKYLIYKGFDVCFVENATDIDDKIIVRSAELQIPPKEVAEKYLKEYLDAQQQLGLMHPDFYPRVTEYIDKIIVYVEQLITRGFAYATPEGDVYFEVLKKEDYGKLSGRKTEDLITGTRVAVESNKRNTLDFALWKKDNTPNASWDSPWGKGRPGWHIECSVMSNDLLGQTIDIHCGGLDLIFPHHENEIAQCEAHNGVQFAKYWVHCGLLVIDSRKMSKSLGNFFTITDSLEKYGKELIVFVILRHHYRSPIDFTDKLFKDNLNALRQFYQFFDQVILQSDDLTFTENEDTQKLTDLFEQAMDDDFNSPIALTVFSDFLKVAQQRRTEGNEEAALAIQKCMIKLGRVLGLFTTDYSQDRLDREMLKFQQLTLNVSPLLPLEEVNSLVQQRDEAKLVKDYQKSDALRNQLTAHGVKLLDNADTGSAWQFLVT